MKIGERVLFLCAMSAANNFADNFGLGTDVGFDEEKAAGHSRSTPPRPDINRSRLCKRR